MKIENIKIYAASAILLAALCACKTTDTKMSASVRSEFDFEKFQNPSNDFRAIPFWSWNEEMRPDEIRKQIDLIEQGGWGGAFVHSRVGLTIPYLGDDWFKAVDATIDECKKRNLKVFLYDEDKWPSGFSGGTVPLANENFRDKALIARPIGAKIPQNCTPIGKPFGGTQIYKWIAPLGHPQFNGTSSVDRMSKDAMAKFIEDAYEPYYKRYSKYYGNVITSEFTDEPCALFRSGAPLGAVAFSTDSFAEFQKEYGYDAKEHLQKIFDDVEGAQRFRIHWYKLNDKMFELNYTKQIGDWCAKHNIDLTGHMMAEGTPFRMRFWGNSVMQNYRHMQVPGVDFLGRKNSEQITAKQCQSVVNQYGKKRMLTELYGVAGGSLTFEDRQWIGLHQIVLGANLLNPHLSLYTMSGCRKRDYPQNIFYQQSWWTLNRELDIPLARLCYATSLGKYNADVLVIHPEASIAALWKPEGVGMKSDTDTTPYNANSALDLVKPDSKAAILPIEDAIQKLSVDLISAQIAYDFGDETIMKDIASVEDGKIKLGQMSYSVVILPAMETLRPSTFKLLKDFKSGGGKILKHTIYPIKIDGEINEELKEFIAQIPTYATERMPEEISKLIQNPLKISRLDEGIAQNIWTQVRDLKDGSRLALIVNQDRNKAFAGEFAFSGNFKRIRLLDHLSGQSKEVFAENKNGQLLLNAEVPQAGAKLYLLDNASPEGSKENFSEIKEFIFEKISAKILDENSLALDYASWTQSLDKSKLSKGSVPVLEIQRFLNSAKYDGPLTLQYKFKTKKLDAPKNLKLVIEYPERCRIFINSKEVKYAQLPYWRDIRWYPIDITPFITEGENTITLEYANFEYGDVAVYKPEKRRYGTEIEAIYLVGDFSVNTETTGNHPISAMLKSKKLPIYEQNVIIAESMYITNPDPVEFGDVSIQGLPHYTGRLEYKFSLPNDDSGSKKIMLCFEKLDTSVAEIFVDGKRVGALFAHPYSLDITAFAKPQAEVKIILYANLFNLMGPSHHISGDLINCSPRDFQANISPKDIAEHKTLLEKWGRREFLPGNYTNNYNVNSFGDIGKVSLKYFEKK